MLHITAFIFAIILPIMLYKAWRSGAPRSRVYHSLSVLIVGIIALLSPALFKIMLVAALALAVMALVHEYFIKQLDKIK